MKNPHHLFWHHSPAKYSMAPKTVKNSRANFKKKITVGQL